MTQGTVLGEKREFVAVDFSRITAAVLVLLVHVHALSSVNGELSYIFDALSGRIAVVFFFVATGFFIQGKIHDRKSVLKYVGRVLRLYVIYSLFFLPVNIIDGINSGKGFALYLISYVRNFFFCGGMVHLWYFLATAFAVWVLHLLIANTKLSDAWILALSLVLYMVGTLFNTYRTVFEGLPVLDKVCRIYFLVFDTTCNGLFYGILFIFIGVLIRKNAPRIRFSPLYPLLALLSVLCMGLEAYGVMNTLGKVHGDMLFFSIPASVFVFLTVAFIKMPQKSVKAGEKFRAASVVLYAFHPFVIFCTDLGKIENSLLRSTEVLIISIAVTFLAVKLSEKFKILKNLY